MSAEPVTTVETRYYGFDPLFIANYAIGMEKLAEQLDEVRELHQRHWSETEVKYLDDEMNPDYDYYIRREIEASFILFTCRTLDMVLVGHLQYFLGPNPHVMGHMLATEDAFFLAPEHRGGSLAGRFLRYAEDSLKLFGVKYVGMSDKSPVGGKNLEPLMRRRGYKPIATYYLKKIQES